MSSNQDRLKYRDAADAAADALADVVAAGPIASQTSPAGDAQTLRSPLEHLRTINTLRYLEAAARNGGRPVIYDPVIRRA